MSGASPFGTLTVAPDELRRFAALAPLATISPVSASVTATPPLAGPMSESASPDTHVRFCTQQTGTVTADAATGIASLIEAALGFANSFEATDLANAVPLNRLADAIAGTGAAGGTAGTGTTGSSENTTETCKEPAGKTPPEMYPPEERNSWERWRYSDASGTGDEPSAAV